MRDLDGLSVHAMGRGRKNGQGMFFRQRGELLENVTVYLDVAVAQQNNIARARIYTCIDSGCKAPVLVMSNASY